MGFPDGTSDFRSDTVTRPTAEMRKAMASAEVGDDVYGEDPSVNALEEEAAAAVGKEAGLFVPSGTMSNQLAIGVQTQPGDEVICVETAHIRNFEVGAGGALWGIQFRTTTSKTGAITSDEIAPLTEPRGAFLPRLSLLAWENTHNWSGGTVTDLDLMRETSSLAKAAGWSVHLDGARMFNAAVASGHSPDAYAEVADTVNFCFSKGLGAPIGSILCGTAELVSEARVLRRRLGGGMRQAGVAAAAASVALRTWQRLGDDHDLAARLATELTDRFPACVDLSQVQTNMVLLQEESAPFALFDLQEAAEKEGVRLAAPSGGRIRLVTHRDVDYSDVQRLLGVVDRLAAR
ncbi:MAG: threonine aldolase family protein [Acidimicrobiia bacterium]